MEKTIAALNYFEIKERFANMKKSANKKLTSKQCQMQSACISNQLYLNILSLFIYGNI